MTGSTSTNQSAPSEAPTDPPTDPPTAAQPPTQPGRTEKKSIDAGLVQRLEFRGDMVDAIGADGGLVGSFEAQTLQTLELASPDDSLDAVVRRVSTTLLTEVTETSVTTQKEIAKGFRSYRFMIWTLFVVGVGGFVAALLRGRGAHTGPEAVATAVFGGLSVTSFVAVFLSQPVRAMSKAGPEAAWLLAIVNTYWTKLAYLNSSETIVDDLDAAQTSMGKAISKYLTATAENDPKVKAAKAKNRRKTRGAKKKQQKQGHKHPGDATTHPGADHTGQGRQHSHKPEEH